jgi:hypothetical protein
MQRAQLLEDSLELAVDIADNYSVRVSTYAARDIR